MIAVLLAASAALALLAPVVGVVHTNDGSDTAAASGALWVMAIPAVVVFALAFVRPVAAIAAGAGLGLVGASRLFADLSLVLTPDGVARPELWVETTDHALPVTPALGSYLVLAADLVALAAGILGAIRLSGLLSFQRDSDFAGSPIDPPADGFAAAPDAVVEARPDFARFDRMDRAVRRNNVMTILGLLGALMLTVGALGLPYAGGYLAARFLPPSVGVAGLVGALVLAVIAATAVLVAGTLPRSLAVALLGGTALGGALPLLVALVAVASTPTNLTPTVWIGLAGAAILTLAGFLARVRLLDVGSGEGAGLGPDGEAGPVRPPSRALDVAIGIGAVVAGGLSVAAYLLPPINAGGLEDLLFLTDGSPVPGSTVFAAAAVPLLIAGVVALVPRIGAAGRGGATLGWAGVVFAVTGTLEVLGDDGLSTARAIGLISIGAGLWCGIAAAGAATVVAILATVSLARASDSADTVDDRRQRRRRAIGERPGGRRRRTDRVPGVLLAHVRHQRADLLADDPAGVRGGHLGRVGDPARHHRRADRRDARRPSGTGARATARRRAGRRRTPGHSGPRRGRGRVRVAAGLRPFRPCWCLRWPRPHC